MNDKDEQLLHRALAGELAADSAELRDLFARHPEIREQFAELASLGGELDRQASAETRAIARARADATPADRAAMAAAFAPQIARGAGAGRGFALGRLARMLVAAGIVAAIAVGLYFATRPSEPDPNPPMLGPNDRPVCIAPRGSGASFEVFQWKGPLPSGARYGVQIHAPATDGPRGALLLETSSSETHWSPNPEQLELLGSSIVWRVVLRVPNGLELASDWVSASR